jgi:hypothetical protein
MSPRAPRRKKLIPHKENQPDIDVFVATINKSEPLDIIPHIAAARVADVVIAQEVKALTHEENEVAI